MAFEQPPALSWAELKQLEEQKRREAHGGEEAYHGLLEGYEKLKLAGEETLKRKGNVIPQPNDPDYMRPDVQLGLTKDVLFGTFSALVRQFGEDEHKKWLENLKPEEQEGLKSYLFRTHQGLMMKRAGNEPLASREDIETELLAKAAVAIKRRNEEKLRHWDATEKEKGISLFKDGYARGNFRTVYALEKVIT